MADPPVPPAEDRPPPFAEPVLEPVSRWRVSLVWLVPLVALAIGASLLVNNVLRAGPRIQIEFVTAEGLEAGKTEVRYKEVAVGRVESVGLNAQRTRVVVTVQLTRSAAGIAVEDSNFWVVRPRIGVGGVSGLGTLVSGAYIGVDAGVSTEERTEFTGLEMPPYMLRGEPGGSFVLRADDLGSLDVGSPVFYRRTQVGRVVGYTLDPKIDELTVKIFVQAPYHTLVTTQTRFWNASGVDLSLNANGLTLNTQTLTSVLAGGVAFAPAPGDTPRKPAADGSRFRLFNDRKAALAPIDGPPLPVRMVFDQSVRGLAPGAPIDLLGVEIGTVREISLQRDERRHRFPAQVLADIYPLRLSKPVDAGVPAPPGANEAAEAAALMQGLVRDGLRAQLQTGNLLTGQLYIALDFQGAQSAARPGTSLSVPGPITVPTAAGALSDLQMQVTQIVDKLNHVPFDGIGRDLQATLRQMNATLAQLTPQASQTMDDVQRAVSAARAAMVAAESAVARADHQLLDPDAPLQRGAEEALVELRRAAQSLRLLADSLERHPEALLRGKPVDPPGLGQGKTP